MIVVIISGDYKVSTLVSSSCELLTVYDDIFPRQNEPRLRGSLSRMSKSRGIDNLNKSKR